VPFVAAKEHLDLGDHKERDGHWNERGHQRINKLLGSLYLDYCSKPKKGAWVEIHGESVESPHKGRNPWYEGA
jgi:hypothetical protein